MLRDYQQAAIDVGIYDYFAHNAGNPVLVLPTGAGKSHIIAAFCKRALHDFKGTRIMMLTHVKELIEQNFEKLNYHWPLAPAGIYSASLNRRDVYDSIIFAGIQSVHKRAEEIGIVDLVLIDECHLVNPKAEGMYRRFIEDMQKINPHLKVIGLTATAYRMGSGDITSGGDSIFTDISYELPIGKLIDDGYLVPVISKATEQNINLTDVHIRGGEFVNKELQAAVDTDDITANAVAEIIEYGTRQNRNSWLIFCVSIEHAEHVRDAFRLNSIRCESLSSKTSKKERERIIAEYKAGAIQALTNCDILTTGFDAPATDLIGFLRPTHSPGLYVQMVGRGMRPDDGKHNCLVLDFAGNVARHGPIDEIAPWIPGAKKTSEAPTKVCDECSSIVHASLKVCPDCGFEFPVNDEPKHAATASSDAVLSRDINYIQEYQVSDVFYSKHEKPGKPASMRVDYMAGMLRVASEWICIEHEGWAHQKAESWWRKRIDEPTPINVDGALALSHYLDKPASITVNTKGKFAEIIGYEFDTESEGQAA